MYFASAACLVLMLSPTVGGVYKLAQASCGTRAVDGMSFLVGEAHPGMTVAVRLGACGSAGPLELDGTVVERSAGAAAYTASARLSLPGVSVPSGTTLILTDTGSRMVAAHV